MQVWYDSSDLKKWKEGCSIVKYRGVMGHVYGTGESAHSPVVKYVFVVWDGFWCLVGFFGVGVGGWEGSRGDVGERMCLVFLKKQNQNWTKLSLVIEQRNHI